MFTGISQKHANELKLKGRKSYHKEDTGKKISEAKKGKQVNGLKILDNFLKI